MLLKCEEDSYLKEFSTKVLACEKTELNTIIDGKKVKVDGYSVLLENTILFPEGGGQPSDHGYLNDQRVLSVARKGDTAIHYLEKPLEVGDTVKQRVDWERRFDHMQQHSGQHLITAIVDDKLGYPTISWWLGEDVSHIEIDTPSITQEEIDKAELIINELIREGRKVTVDVYQDKVPEEKLSSIRSRGLPADHKGEIRVVVIEGVEGNMCCGTHVTNTSQLQVVKLLHAEKSKRKDKTLLYFLVGNRVINKLRTCIAREQKLTSLLKNGPPEHPDLVDKLVKNVKTLTKNLQNILREMAIFEAHKFKSITPPPKYYSLHKKEAEPDFMSVFLKEVGSTETFLFLSTGDDKGIGNILLYGNEKAIADLGNQVSEVLIGKGAGKGNKFQAKVTKLSARSKAEKLIEDYFTK